MAGWMVLLYSPGVAVPSDIIDCLLFGNEFYLLIGLPLVFPPGVAVKSIVWAPSGLGSFRVLIDDVAVVPYNDPKLLKRLRCGPFQCILAYSNHCFY